MCRILAYLGEPLPAAHLLFDTDNCLVRQSYSPRMMNTFLNLAGFGMKAWDPMSHRPEEPFTYRTTTLPSFDRNLRLFAAKLAPRCLVAHVRGVVDGEQAMVTEANLHPFRLPGARVALAHNGHLRECARTRPCARGFRPASRGRIAGPPRAPAHRRAGRASRAPRAIPVRGCRRRMSRSPGVTAPWPP